MDCRSVYLAGLITLIVIELVLGIDNLVFLPSSPKNYRRSSATAHGLPGAAGDVNAPVTAGVNLLAGHLTQPLFSFRSFTFSARDLIMCLVVSSCCSKPRWS